MVSRASILFLITTQILDKILCDYLEAELNYQKPKRERTNIVNKAIWIRSNAEGNIENHYSRFFHENSIDLDGQIQNFDIGDPRYAAPVFAPELAQQMRKKRSGNSMHDKNKRNWLSKPQVDQKKTKISNFINNFSSITDKLYNEARQSNNDTTYLLQNNSSYTANNSLPTYDNDLIALIKDSDENNVINSTNNNATALKRSMQYDFETEVIKHFEFSEELNKTDENRDPQHYKENRNVFDKSNTEWHQNAPVPDINVYRVVPKEPVQRSKPVTERGLIKVISMLTRSFRKIMKQHAEIATIHTKISEINEDFAKTTGVINAKFKDFDLKYLYLVKLQEKLKDYNTRIEMKEEYFKNKEKEMARNFLEFENQQKKFLQQQKQFYSMQKLMLAQNEKINMKQSLIAKTQSEISHRQNNFARMLKKAKQLYVDRHISIGTHIYPTKEPPKYTTELSYVPNITSIDITTEPIKINLFSLPSSYRIQQDPDELILREKDQQPIDDLVYKYYFNNTFLDSVMQKHILNSFIGNGAKHSGGNQNMKSKRDDNEATILPPLADDIYESENFESNNRIKRWINHHSKHNKRKNRGKEALPETANYTDAKQSIKNQALSNNLDPRSVKPIRKTVDREIKHDPFLTMAMKFCKEIGNNQTQQTLSWCVEKTLRRLQFLHPKSQLSPAKEVLTTITSRHTNPPVSSISVKKQKSTEPPKQTSPPTKRFTPVMNIHNKPTVSSTSVKPKNPSASTKTSSKVTNSVKTTTSTTVKPSPAIKAATHPPSSLRTTNIAYTRTHVATRHRAHTFPDNNKLEYNLKMFLSDSVPDDLEGNVYYEGSARESDVMEQGV